MERRNRELVRTQYACKYTYVHTYSIHTYIHTYTYAYAYAYKYTYCIYIQIGGLKRLRQVGVGVGEDSGECGSELMEEDVEGGVAAGGGGERGGGFPPTMPRLKKLRRMGGGSVRGAMGEGEEVPEVGEGVKGGVRGGWEKGKNSGVVASGGFGREGEVGRGVVVEKGGEVRGGEKAAGRGEEEEEEEEEASDEVEAREDVTQVLRKVSKVGSLVFVLCKTTILTFENVCHSGGWHLLGCLCLNLSTRDPWGGMGCEGKGGMRV